MSVSADEHKRILPQDICSRPAVKPDYDMIPEPDILTGIFRPESEKVFEILKDLKDRTDEGLKKDEKFLSDLDCARAYLSGFTNYYRYRDRISVVRDGVRYGAYAEKENGPLGGGAGYGRIITGGDITVHDGNELFEALTDASEGDVIFIPSDLIINITSLNEAGKIFPVGKGVTLCSDRGRKLPSGRYSAGGGIIVTDTVRGNLFSVSDNARITGLRIMGGDMENHEKHHTRCFYDTDGPKRGYEYYGKLPYLSRSGFRVTGSGAEFDNCEITGFAYAAVDLMQGAHDTHVHNCYIHHNRGKGLGYGVCHTNETDSVVEYCIFNFNRHDVASTGRPPTSYTARFNLNLGDSLDHVYDVHGGRDRGDGTDIAGTSVDMYNDTFLSPQSPYHVRGGP